MPRQTYAAPPQALRQVVEFEAQQRARDPQLAAMSSDELTLWAFAVDAGGNLSGKDWAAYLAGEPVLPVSKPSTYVGHLDLHPNVLATLKDADDRWALFLTRVATGDLNPLAKRIPSRATQLQAEAA